MKILLFFNWWGKEHPKLSIMENSLVPKIFKPIRIYSFTKNFPRKALSFGFIFYLAVQQTYKISFVTDGFWSSLFCMFFIVFLCSLSSLCFLKFKTKFLHQYAYMSDRNAIPQVTHTHTHTHTHSHTHSVYIYLYIYIYIYIYI